MPSSYFTMWGMLFLMALGAAGELVSPSDVTGWFRAAYPVDTLQRDALNRCSQADGGFWRFSAEDRNACYRVVLHASVMPGSDR